MSYISAKEVLPQEILESVQRYVDGRAIYIPRKTEEKRAWGQATETRERLRLRNERMYAQYREGISVRALAARYFLTEKSVQRIIRKMKLSDKT